MTRTTLRTRFAALAVAGLFVAGVGACGSTSSSTTKSTSAPASSKSTPGASAAPATSAKVDIINFSFKPATIDVKVGGTVTWKQMDSTGHSVKSVSTPPSWTTSKVLNMGQTFAHKFTKAGTYKYICGVHNYMMGTVVVK